MTSVFRPPSTWLTLWKVILVRSVRKPSAARGGVVLSYGLGPGSLLPLVWNRHRQLAPSALCLSSSHLWAGIYVVFCLLCFTPLCRLSFVAWVHMFPNKQDPGLWLSMLYLPPLIVMLTLSLLAATYFLPLLASAVIISVVATFPTSLLHIWRLNCLCRL